MRTAEELATAAAQLHLEAEESGRVLAIEQRPVQPLAMGNIETVITVRQSLAGWRGVPAAPSAVTIYLPEKG